MRVQRVLVPGDAAAVDDGAVGAHAQRHRLVPRRPRPVLHRHVAHHEPKPGRGKGGGPEGGIVVSNAAVAGDHCDALAVPDEQQVGLLHPHLDVLVIPSLLDVYHRPALAALGRRLHGVGDGGVCPRAVLGDHNVGARSQRRRGG
uniref:Uncharacterized protein n=1 Tax=Zea mays TaxID=4577 RepID=C4J4I5_MAIZE|nr:unknown [Zea mays]